MTPQEISPIYVSKEELEEEEARVKELRRMISRRRGRVEARAELIRVARRSISSLRGWQIRDRAQISVWEDHVEARSARLRRVQETEGR